MIWWCQGTSIHGIDPVILVSAFENLIFIIFLYPIGTVLCMPPANERQHVQCSIVSLAVRIHKMIHDYIYREHLVTRCHSCIRKLSIFFKIFLYISWLNDNGTHQENKLVLVMTWCWTDNPGLMSHFLWLGSWNWCFESMRFRLLSNL